ncbi:MAG: DUF3822 family protein [Clostridium sp.]|nr:DUF3822 family protein [Prevotella sp.]MCM1429403.1 DUF3822 family protein [Clostridium sp.]
MENDGFDRRMVDYRDTGLWRLTIEVSGRGMSACLTTQTSGSKQTEVLFRSTWENTEPSLLAKIEDAVYDHPRLLDDYATEIIVETPKSIFVPDIYLEEIGSEADLLGAVYPAESEDIFTDNLTDRQGKPTTYNCVYTLTPGLPAFLRRTLPGAKTRCQLSILAEKFRNQTSEMPRIYADIRNSEVDIIAFNGTQLLSSATSPWEAPSDIAYRIMLLIKSYELPSDGVEVRLSGITEAKTETAGILRKILGYVVYTPEPAGTTRQGLSLAMGIAIEK